MSFPLDSRQWRIGLVGYGEVGRILAEDLRALGLPVQAYDLKCDERDQAAGLRQHADKHHVTLLDSAAALAARSELVISAVTASQAVAVARASAPALREQAYFLDLNSASPGAKQSAAEFIMRAGGRYVEGAVMTSVPPYRSQVPLLLGGAYATELEPLLNALGFSAHAGSEHLGRVSATKMCRSVMIKGLEAMVIESLTAARFYGVEEAVIASLRETFPGIDWEQQAAYFFQRVIQHGRRRAEEMREAAVTVRETGLTPWSASGTAERQAWVADLADNGLFGDKNSPRQEWRTPADCILRGLTAAD